MGVMHTAHALITALLFTMGLRPTPGTDHGVHVEYAQTLSYECLVEESFTPLMGAFVKHFPADCLLPMFQNGTNYLVADAACR